MNLKKENEGTHKMSDLIRSQRGSLFLENKKKKFKKHNPDSITVGGELRKVRLAENIKITAKLKICKCRKQMGPG